MTREVVIIGAGPVGLSLALGLAREGRDVLVLEKEPHTAEHSRAPVIWPRTLEVLEGIGVASNFLNKGTILKRLEVWDADREKVLFTAPIEELENETAYPHMLILPQSQTELLLLEALQRQPSAEVRFSCEATGLRQENAIVDVSCWQNGSETSVQAQFAAGCDGAHSLVRHELGAVFDGETYKVRAALADVDLEGSKDFRFPRFTSRARIAIGIRISQRLWRLILPFGGSDEIPLDRRVQDAVKHLFHTENYHTVWQSEFQLHRRVSSIFAQGRVVLAGDAAHLNSPVGGQGMNAGIQDTELLTRALLKALNTRSIEPLEKFAGQRRKAIQEGVNRFTDILTRTLLFGGGRAIRPVFHLANASMKLAPARRRMLRKLAMLEG